MPYNAWHRVFPVMEGPESAYKEPEQFKRVIALWGLPAFQRIKAFRVLLLGVGAVGSACLEALLRSGIHHITVVDGDKVEATNINRQLVAYHSTIGLAKVDVAATRAKDINPGAEVKALQQFVTPEMVESLVRTERPSLVIDAIDSVPTKVELASFCILNKIPLCASMGAARRQGLVTVKATGIMHTEGCPLAKTVRSWLRKRHITPDMDGNTRAIFSTGAVVPMAGKEFLPSCICTTMVFGSALASLALEYAREGSFLN